MDINHHNLLSTKHTAGFTSLLHYSFDLWTPLAFTFHYKMLHILQPANLPRSLGPKLLGRRTILHSQFSVTCCFSRIILPDKSTPHLRVVLLVFLWRYKSIKTFGFILSLSRANNETIYMVRTSPINCNMSTSPQPPSKIPYICILPTTLKLQFPKIVRFLLPDSTFKVPYSSLHIYLVFLLLTIAMKLILFVPVAASLSTKR